MSLLSPRTPVRVLPPLPQLCEDVVALVGVAEPALPWLASQAEQVTHTSPHAIPHASREDRALEPATGRPY